MIETKTIKVEAYRDPEGRPTCAVNFCEGKYCKFYETASFGTVEVCAFDNEIELSRYEGKGYLIPSKKCPIWSEDVKVD
jgi:hypothetical protein